MNTKKTVYEKLFTEKVELAKHEVELALRDDIITGFQKYLGQVDGAVKAANKAENMIIEAYNQYATLAGFANGTLRDVDVMKVKAKELGLTLDPDMTGIEKKLKDDVKKVMASANSIKTLASTLSAIKTSTK